VVAHPEVDPTMSRLSRASVLALVLAMSAVGLGLASVPGAASASLVPAATSAVTGNITGPAAVALNSTSNTYYINATGGPAIASNGAVVGTINFTATLGGLNITNVTIVPSSGTITPGTPLPVVLQVNNLTQTLTITVQLTSSYDGTNATATLSYSLVVVRPYILYGELVVGPNAGTLPFRMVVDLDGTRVGTIAVPALKPNETYNFTFVYATTGLSSGVHTFTISLQYPDQGLVTFAGGAREYSASFDIPGPAPNNTIWIVVGIVAFFGTLFILATRVAARRRGVTRR
jgi:hypothetical protein